MTDERMWGALAAIQEDIDYLTTMQRTEFGDGHLRGLEKAKHLMISALSPPARRTSYEWVDRAGFTHRVRWGPSAHGGWRVEFWGDNGWSAPVPSSRELSVLAAAIATLAGLEKEEDSR